MTEAAKRDASFDESLDNHGIAEDDPLFELSRIMGLDADAPLEPGAEIDPQIDLEDALMAEMAVETEQSVQEPIVEVEAPQVETPSVEVPRFQEEIQPEALVESQADVAPVLDDIAAPTPASLEDELTEMLGDKVSVATEAPEYAEALDEPFVSEAPSIETVPQFEDALEAVQPQEAVVGIETETVHQDAAVSEDFVAAEEIAPDAAENVAPLEEMVAADPLADLEDDFTAFFDEEMPKMDVGAADVAPEPEFEPVIEVPLEELNALAFETTEVETGHVDAEMAVLDDQIEDIFGADVADAAKANAEQVAAPALETTDMSAFEEAEAVDINVPDLPEIEDEFVVAFDESLTSDFAAEPVDDGFGAAAATAALGATVATGATVLSRKAGESAMDADDESFDETRFEAELARDMEFVGHDLEADAASPAELSFDEEFEGQEFAAAAAANKPARRGLVVAAVLGCVAIAGAVGYFAFNGDTTNGEPVLVEADVEPIKVAPTDPGGKEVPNQDRAVFAETQVEPAQEALNAASEEPVDVATLPSSVGEQAAPEAVAQKQEERLTPSETENTAATAGGQVAVAPRRVRTLVVTPEGNLVERAVVPTPEPIAPATEVAAAPEPVVTPEPVVAPEPVAAPQPAATPQVAATPQPAAPAPQTVPTRTVRTQTVTPGSIADRPADQPVNIVNPVAQNTQVAVAPAAPAPAPAAPAATSTPYAVQLASLPSQASAQDTASNLSRRFSGVLGGRGLSIRQAVIEGRGTFYRVRVGANSRADANALCSSIKSAGGDCFVTR